MTHQDLGCDGGDPGRSIKTKADAEALGIMAGDYVCFEPRFRVTEKGYIKSRFLDDKLSSAILMGYARYLKDEKVATKRRIYLHFTIYEEVGHGGCAPVPQGVTEAWSVDMGCVGQGLSCTAAQGLHIAPRTAAEPYSSDVVKTQIRLAKENGIDFAVDIYPHYGSDVEASSEKPETISPTDSSNQACSPPTAMRSHVDGVEKPFRLL